MPNDLISISPVEFANRFATSIRDQGQRFTWFIGAGCSISSGISAAGGLVEKWLREIQGLQNVPSRKFEDWRKTAFPDFDPVQPARHYAQVFGRRHPAPADRQREIERLCENGEPSYGYATFAQILSHAGVGERCNTILTTNFDDLIADALYMYGDRRMRPQIITHEALARYVRIASPRPTIVKLHGDAHLDPKNLMPETSRLDEEITKQIHPFVQDSAIVFVGYGGNDLSIFRFFDECPAAKIASQIFWVGKHDPSGAFLNWLSARSAIRVDHADFDRLMHHLRGALKIDHPSDSRWKGNFERYLEQYKLFEEEVNRDPDSEEKAALKQTSQDVSKSLPTGWDYYQRALSAELPDEIEAIYREGIDANSNSPILLGAFASFLKNVRKDMDGAEPYYKRAIEADPANANNLGNYALFLESVRNDAEGAEPFYKRAVEADPKNATVIGNYARFHENVRKDMDNAEVFYKRAIEADPKNAINLGNYALFLETVRKDVDGAEPLYKRAIESDAKNAAILGNYALFLETVRKDMDGAEPLYKRAIEADPRNAIRLSNYALFLKNVRKDTEGAEPLYKRAVEADPKNATILGNYARFLESIRNDMDGAETFYKRAIEAGPRHTVNLGNYALFLETVRKDMDGAETLYKRAIETDPEHQTILSNYNLFLKNVRKIK
jgi:protein O-mannosyl-transferase